MGLLRSFAGRFEDNGTGAGAACGSNVIVVTEARFTYGRDEVQLAS